MTLESYELPLVSVLIACRNEQRFIGRCLESILENGYPLERLEILVIDGRSEDQTRTIVEAYARRFACIRLLTNKRMSFPAAMNIGVANSSGDLIMIQSAHSTYSKGYLAKCVEYSKASGADNVGGILRICPRKDTPVAQAIARALSHPFGSGNAYAKIGSKEPRWADTAAFGCYRRRVFQAVGSWNEMLVGSADLDFNARLHESGGRTLLVPDIEIQYFSDADLRSFWRHNFADGVWATYVLKFGSRAWSWRHWVPFLFVSSLLMSAAAALVIPGLSRLFLGIVLSYVIANVAASLQVFLRHQDPWDLVFLPVVFSVRHLAHGLGALVGLFSVLVPGNVWKGRAGRHVGMRHDEAGL